MCDCVCVSYFVHDDDIMYVFVMLFAYLWSNLFGCVHADVLMCWCVGEYVYMCVDLVM